MRIELDDNFISKVKKQIKPHWGELGWVTYKRTYARWLPDKNRSEEWDETVKRVVEGNINLDPRLHKDRVPINTYLELQNEAQLLFKFIYGLSGATSGRNLWISGTDFQKRNGDALNNCLRGTERVFIKNMGLVPIAELKGEYEVLSDGGVYRKADFRSHGKQNLMKITFKDGQEVFATPTHEWIVFAGHTGTRKKDRVFTKDLKPGNEIPVIRPKIPSTYDEEGFVHGFVYGDGTRISSGYSRVSFFKDKAQLFDMVLKFGDKTPNKIPTITNLPYNFKDLPMIGDHSKEYLLGFILGLISADGHIRGTETRLHAKDKHSLEYIREMAQYIGLKVNLVRLDRKLSPYTGEVSPLYSLSFSAETFPGHLLPRTDQRDNFHVAKRIAKYPYKEIKSVEETDLFEEVFCCNEPETHSFVLEDGILTGNCWFVAIRPQKYGNSHIVPHYMNRNRLAVSMPFSFLFDQLMKGGGVGFSVAQENIKQIPIVDQNIKLTVIVGKENGNYNECIKLGATDRDKWYKENGGVPTPKEIIDETSDSREGWVKSNALLIDSHFSSFRELNDVVIDVSEIREKGKRIHGFGGTASGPMPFVQMLFSINNILNKASDEHRSLTSVDCVDICNYIGKTVIAGNVRRSAEIAIGDEDDTLFITAKQDQEALMDRRWASNNSVFIDQNTQDFSQIAKAIAQNGEPGVVNIDNLRNYGRYIDGRQEGIDKDVEGMNPCGEISLDNGEPCNLFEVFPSVAEEQGWKLKDAFRLATRFAKRVTFSPYEWEISQNVIRHNRRIGVSISGFQDWVLNKFNTRVVKTWDGDEPIFNPDIVKSINNFYSYVIDADKEYSGQLHCNVSVKHTTVKPSGTVSKLAGVSEGMHFNFDKYIIQRIRFQDSDPLISALKKSGYHIEDDVYSTNTKVCEFPIKAVGADKEHFVSANDVSIEEQFANQAFLQTYWADNAVSCTITFKKNEAHKIEKLLKQYQGIIKSTSLLPYTDSGYQQMPKESITKDRYEKMKKKITYNVHDVFVAEHTDVRDLEIEGADDCATGHCPTK